MGMVVVAASLLVLARVAVATIGVDRSQRLLTSVAVPTRLFPVDAEHIPWAVETGATVIPAAVTCLPRAVVCQAMLAARGVETKIRLGVDPADDFAAHAWVERGDEVLIGGDVADFDRYRPLD